MGGRGEKQKNKPLSPETLSIAQAYWRGQGEVLYWVAICKGLKPLVMNIYDNKGLQPLECRLGEGRVR
jgi:hypothetical protein